MKYQFKSSDFTFRPTTLGAAFAALGAKDVPLVREAKREGFLRAKTDRFNLEPSVVVSPIPCPSETPGAFGRKAFVAAPAARMVAA